MAKLSTYQKQASSIYDPQLKAAIAGEANKRATTLAGLEDEQRTIEPEYQKALRGINDQVQSEEGRINQLYSQRLGGQFSGLQGNDMGMMYSKANQNRSDIETTRANKLAGIASKRTLAGNEYSTSVNALRSKYQGLEAQYAQSAYQQALKDEEARRQFEEQMAFRRSQAASSAASSASAGPSLTEKIRSMLSAATGEDGKVSPTTWRQIVAYAYDNGLKFGGKNGFASKFWQYANDQHWRDYQLGYDRYM